MYCKKCGKALGTDRGICPFCGTMFSKEQLEIYKEQKKENMYKPELITEKYGEKPVVYEKNEIKENKVLGFIIVLSVLIFLTIIALFMVLK